MTDVFTWPVDRADQTEPTRLAPRAPFRHVGAYVVATAVGGALAGYAIGKGGSLLLGLGGFADQAVGALIVALALFAIWLELRGKVRPLPQRRAQVRRGWLLWRRRSLTAGAFGMMIGSGALTYLEHAVAYTLVSIVLLSPSSLVALIIGAVYGLTRGLTLLGTWFAQIYLGRDIPWERLIGAERLVGGTLAATAAVSLVGIAILRDPFGGVL